jgi:outer membrane protein
MTKMKKMMIAVAVCALCSLAAFAQTPTPPARPAAAGAAAAPTGGTGAEGKLAVIVTGAFREGITELKVKLDALNVEFEPKRKEFEVLENEVNNLRNKIQAQGNTVSAAVRGQWNDEFAEKEKRYKRMGEDLQALADRRLAEVSQPVQDKIFKALEQYCQQRGIIMVIEASAAQQAGVLLFAAQATNITDDFMKEYNKANPVTPAPTTGAKK